SELSAAVVLIERLAKADVFRQIETRLALDRKGGGHGIAAAVLFLVAYFASSFGGGLRPFWNFLLSRGHGRGGKVVPVPSRLASIAGMASMCSPAALSRILGTVQ